MMAVQCFYRGPSVELFFAALRSHSLTVHHPAQRRVLEPGAEEHKAVEDIVRGSDKVKLAWPLLLREAGGVQQRTENVACATGSNVGEAEAVAGKAQALRENYVGDGHDGREAESDKGEGAVPPVGAVVGAQDDVGRSETGSGDAQHVDGLESGHLVKAIVEAWQNGADDKHDDANLSCQLGMKKRTRVAFVRREAELAVDRLGAGYHAHSRPAT